MEDIKIVFDKIKKKNCVGIDELSPATTYLINLFKNQANLLVFGIPHDDLQGLSPPPSKIPEEDINLAKAYILSILAYESHYCRKDLLKQYLLHHYILTRMYDEYKKWLSEEKKPVSKFKYQEIFYSMGIKIKNPSKDTCATCDKFRMNLKTAKDINRRQEIQVQLDVHQKEAADAYDAKRLDKNAALKVPSKRIYTFDLQQCYLHQTFKYL
ncbi:unnamed protein product [Psylliodes chrysocephalus]|uniref:Uncharacterized protein n=1 Tax=Psylliodes chrysocephalus TaxID=3402493 RepID=A0A9P0G7I0_9CUCU|nr:unnamed protein product [Psylliodes chrysocephala]